MASPGDRPIGAASLPALLRARAATETQASAGLLSEAVRESEGGSLRYDRTTIFFHWLVAGLVTAQWLGAQIIDWFPAGAWRIDARSVHITMGALLLPVILARLAWRLTKGRHLPALRGGIWDKLARTIHAGLYAAIIAMIGAGLFGAWTRGDSLFGRVKISPYDPGNAALGAQVIEIHAVIGWIIVGLVGLHVGAALWHRYVWRDRLLARMLWR
jgi:cytochrome b561